MPDVTWVFEFKGESSTASGLVGIPQRATYRRASPVEPTPVFKFNTDAAYETVKGYVLEATEETVVAGSLSLNTPYYRERPPSGISSFVVKVAPGAGVGSTGAFWAVIQGGSDASGAAGTPKRLEMDLFILADAGDYTDHAAVETALGTEVV